MEATEGNNYKVVFINPWITAISTWDNQGDNNECTIFQPFEVNGNDSYNWIYSFKTDCIETEGIEIQKNCTGSIEMNDCEDTNPEGLNVY